MKSFLGSFLPSLLTSSCSGSWQMISVTHFTDTLLKAVEDELTVRVPFVRIENELIFSFVVLGHQATFQEWDHTSIQCRSLLPKLSLPCKLSIGLPRPSRSPTRQGPQPTSRLLCLARPRRRRYLRRSREGICEPPCCCRPSGGIAIR